MNHEATLRRTREGDGAALCEIQIAAIRELGKSHYTQAEVDAWSGYHDGSLSPEKLEKGIPGRFGIVAEVGSYVVAFGTLDENGDVRAVYVRPAYARQGIGSAVLDELLSKARRRGLVQVRTKASLSGEAFYAKAGFKVQERCKHRFRDSAEIDSVWMVKKLDSKDAEPSTEADAPKPAP